MNAVDSLQPVSETLAMVAPPLILVLPFVLLLAAMALGPVLAPQWWLKHYSKVALGLGSVTAAAYLFFLPDSASLWHAAHEYLGFIALVGSLYLIAGGIQIRLAARPTPLVNVLFLLGGALAANVLGTTGAAMLLIRPWIRLNQARIRPYHVVFFIFLVANVGGGLTPIGDPPLFLGFLQGVPFWWVAQHVWPLWAMATGWLLAIFFVCDQISFSRAKMNTSVSPPQTAGVDGLSNLFFLAIVLAALFLHHPPFLRESLMLAAGLGSYLTTKKSIHAANEFDFHPLAEVAVLFAGIFATMIPALAWLEHHAARLLGSHPGPGIFFWGTGSLSALLDNAPTYLGFLNALFGVAGHGDMPPLLEQQTAQLMAISAGAVFFGAATYIGNGPNFMVKAIADRRGVPMPSFVEFVLKYSLPLLAPALVLVWFFFLRD